VDVPAPRPADDVRSVPLAAPLFGSEELELLRIPLDSGWVTQGPMVAAFEARFAEIHQVDHAIATSSGTTALHLVLLALGIGAGDEVLVPSFTWVATANAVAYCNAVPVFVDVDPVTYNMTPETVQRRLTERTKAVMVVHQFGLPADVDGIRSIVPETVSIVEDAACAVGARYHDRPVGGLGIAGAFSFHPRKVITTGEGGMITTDDAHVADTVRVLRNHGMGSGAADLPPLQSVAALGYNYRMSDLHGALGMAQLQRLDQMLDARRRAARWYRDALADIAWLRLPQVPDDCTSSWQSFVVVLEPGAPRDRDRLALHLAQRGIETRPGTHAVSELPLYGACAADCPVSRELAARSLAIPLHNRMEADDYRYVVDSIREIE
jgi:dTDP-4-amino-4,6-dideoxygalactose transaminase